MIIRRYVWGDYLEAVTCREMTCRLHETSFLAERVYIFMGNASVAPEKCINSIQPLPLPPFRPPLFDLPSHFWIKPAFLTVFFSPPSTDPSSWNTLTETTSLEHFSEKLFLNCSPSAGWGEFWYHRYIYNWNAPTSIRKECSQTIRDTRLSRRDVSIVPSFTPV